jgi:two-component system, cell cycle response regulator DivK
VQVPSSVRMPLILVVDDDPDNRDLYVATLGMRKLRVEVAADGIEAIAKAQQTLPDLILMDVGLPGLSGLEAVRRLKRSAATGRIPVLACTGYVSPETRDDAKAAGCAGFVAKPWFPEDLLAEVARWTTRRPRQGPHDVIAPDDVQPFAGARTVGTKDGTTAIATPVEPSNACASDRSIAARAYELYRQRGGGAGHELDDWLQAEVEVHHRRKTAASQANGARLPA